MTCDRVILVENPAELNIDIQRVRIRRSGADDAFVAPNDVAVLILHHHTISLSVSVLRKLSDAGAIVLVTNEFHMPTAVMLPTAANRAASSRLRQQIAQMDSEQAVLLWQTLVKARIATQAANLRQLQRKGALRLERLIDEVEPGDKTHCEGQAARHYWRHLFDDFKREKKGPRTIRTHDSTMAMPCYAAWSLAN